jgi:alkanesulfonate monooxygenase SsuD/methylene tetrahydromethanopterin reductase-like flavin-dependent oxidoreductase (luciferase family)
MTLRFGVHTGPSNTTVEELQRLWRYVEERPFDWISIWDHLYSADTISPHNFDAVAIHTALALTTKRVRCGSLVYCAAFRHPAVLAKAMATIDHLSGGRCEFGIGAGWARFEFNAYGIPYEHRRTRLDVMEDSLATITTLLHQGTGARANRVGPYFTVTDAAFEPAPIQPHLPIWVGGAGEQRTLRIAAKYADGWNIPFASAEVFAHKSRVLDQRCEEIGRDPSTIARSVNLGYARDEASLRAQLGDRTEFARDGVLIGATDQIADQVQAYVDAGATQINLALRAPFAYDAVDALAEYITEHTGSRGPR